ERQPIWVVTRPGFKKNSHIQGPKPEVLLGPGKEVTGTVTDRATGKPVAGIEVLCGNEKAVTNAGGEFRTDGLRKEPSYLGWVSGTGYFSKRLEFKDTPANDPIRLDITVERGIVLEGRLLDQTTRKPVSGVVQYHAQVDNPHLKDYGFQGFSPVS